MTALADGLAEPLRSRAGAALLRSASVLGQLCQAAASFLLTLAFAHLLDAAGFGALAVSMLVFMLLMTAFRAVFGEQVLARPSTDDARSVGQLALVAGALYALAGATLCVLLGQPGLLAGVLFFGGFAASDGVRYAWLATGSARDRAVLLAVDAGRAVLAATALGLAASVPAAAQVLAVLAGVVWLGLGVQRFGLPEAAPLRRFLRSRGAFELAMTAQFLLGTGIAQLLPVAGLWAFGAGVFGEIRLAQSIVAPAATLASAFQPAVLTAYSRAALGSDRARLLKLIGLACAACALLLPVGVGLASAVVTVTLGDRGVAVLPFLVPAALGVAGGILSLPGGAVIRVRRFARVSFTGAVIGTVVGVLLCAVGILAGPVAFAWGLTAGALCTIAVSYLLLFRRLD